MDEKRDDDRTMVMHDVPASPDFRRSPSHHTVTTDGKPRTGCVHGITFVRSPQHDAVNDDDGSDGNRDSAD